MVLVCIKGRIVISISYSQTLEGGRYDSPKLSNGLIGTEIVGLAALLGIGSFASADPLPGEQLKFFQSPLNGSVPGSVGVYPVGAVPLPTDTPAPFLGHDELSTATLNATNNTFTGTMMADDFLDINPNPIGHINFWGSYMNNTDPGTANPGVPAFKISLYTDVPATTGAKPQPSHPGSLIVSQTVTSGALAPSSGTFTVKPVPPNGPGAVRPGDSILYEYNAELNWQAKNFPDAFFDPNGGQPIERD